jgi:hypothetical protein
MYLQRPPAIQHTTLRLVNQWGLRYLEPCLIMYITIQGIVACVLLFPVEVLIVRIRRLRTQ